MAELHFSFPLDLYVQRLVLRDCARVFSSILLLAKLATYESSYPTLPARATPPVVPPSHLLARSQRDSSSRQE